MAVNEQDAVMGSMSGAGSGGFPTSRRRTVAGTLAAKVTAEGVRKLTGDFSGLLGVLVKVRTELGNIRQLSKSDTGAIGFGGGVGRGTPTGAAGTGGGTGMITNILGNFAGSGTMTGTAPSSAFPGPGGSTPPGGGPPAGLPVASVRGPGGFNYGALSAGLQAVSYGMNALDTRFQRNLFQSAPISSQDALTASMYGTQYQGAEMRRMAAAGPYGGSRESQLAAQQIALGLGSTMAGTTQSMAWAGNMVQASGGTMTAAQATATSGLFASPLVSRRAEAIGISTYKENGILQNPMKVGLEYVQDYERRFNVKMNEIDFSNLRSPGSAHRARMKQIYGLSDEAIDMVITAGMQNVTFRKTPGTGGRDINFGSSEDLGKIGLDQNVLGLQLTRFGTTTATREARHFEDQESAMVGRLEMEGKLQDVLSDTEHMFRDILGPLGEFHTILKGIVGALGLVAGVGMLGGGGGLGGGLATILGRGGATGAPGGVPGVPGAVPAAGAAGMTTAARLGMGAAGATLGIAGAQMINSAETPAGTLGGIASMTAAGAMIGTAIPLPGFGTATGAIAGFAVGTAFAAKNYFSGVDKQNVEEGYEVGVGMTDKDLIDSMGDYIRNAEFGGQGEGAGAKQRGRFDAFAQRRGALLAAALDEAHETGVLKLTTSAEGSNLAELINFFMSDGVFNDDKLWNNKAKAEPYITKIRSTGVWRKYFGGVADPFAYTPVTTPESTSLIMTAEEAFSAAMGEQTGDGAFSPYLGNDPYPSGGDPISDRAAGKGATWDRLDGRMKERLLRLFRASGGRLWLGNGWRSSEDQERMFRDRYTPDPSGEISWNGQRWRHVSGPAAAPPGRSMHEIGLAADLDGDMAWLQAHAGEFGLKTFANVNNEAWHVQPTELPNSRAQYEAGGGGAATDGSAGGDLPSQPAALMGGGGGGTSSINYSMAAAAAAVFAPGPVSFATSDSGGVGGGGGEFSGDDMQRAIAAARAASAAGFSGQALINMVAIAGRESSWVPTAHRSDRDKSLGVGDRGLWQINYINDPGLRAAGIIDTWRDLLNPLVNARAAYRLSNGGSNLSPWAAGPGGFQGGGNPFYGTDIENARRAVEQAGLGDGSFAAGPSGGSATVNIDVQINSTGNVRYDAQALGEAVRPVLTNVMAEISTKRGS